MGGLGAAREAQKSEHGGLQKRQFIYLLPARAALQPLLPLGKSGLKTLELYGGLEAGWLRGLQRLGGGAEGTTSLSHSLRPPDLEVEGFP